MKKISKCVSVVFLSLVMMFVMTACGETGNNGQDGNNDQKSAASQTAGVTNAASTSADNENAEVVTLQLSLESDNNLAFSKYDMNVYFDGCKLTTLKNGEKYSTTLDVTKGSHELKLTKADEESMNSVETISLDSSKAISYFVKHDRNSIDISRTETKDIVEDQSKNETTAPMTAEPTTEKATEAPTEEPTTEEVTEESTTEEETEPSTEEQTTSASNNGVPVIVGIDLETINSVCKELELKQMSDQSESEITRLRIYQGVFSPVSIVGVIYYTETMEVLQVAFTMADPRILEDTGTDIMKKLVNSMSPANSTASVLEWIDEAKQNEANSEIDGYYYEISEDIKENTFSYSIRHPKLYDWAVEKGVVETSEAPTEGQDVEARVMAQVKTNGLTYSTNDSETAKNGNSGKFAYKKSGKNYDIYFIIDFDEGYVYCFQDARGDISCEKVKIVSGDMNEYVLITYHADDGTTWNNALSFKRKKQPNIMSFQDGRNDPVDYNSTDINKAIDILNTKTVHEY